MKRLIIILSLIVLVLVLVFYGEELLPVLWNGLHLFLEFLELMVDKFFEGTIGLHHRESQMLTVWTGVIFALLLTWIFMRGFTRWAQRAARASVSWEQRKAGELKAWYNSVSDLHKVLAATVIALLGWLLFYLFL
jgi:hypothetical protein